MKKTLVLGIGNRLMTDDGIGVYLAEDLGRSEEDSRIEYFLGETDVDCCAEKIDESNLVILIDAFISGKLPGDVTAIPLSDLKDGIGSCCSMHGLHILDAMRLANRMPEGILIGIEPCELQYGLGLSDSLRCSYPHILAVVKRYIEAFANGMEAI